MLASRSTEESHLYMHLHPCECGEADFEWHEHRLVQREEGLVSIYSGDCERCARARSFEFLLVPEPSPPPPALGGDRPSSIIDPGEFLQTSQVFAGSVPEDPASLSDDEYYGAYDALMFAIVSVEEVLKFIPDGVDAVPGEAFRTDHGRRLHRHCPELFTRSGLAATRDAYRRLLAAYDATVSADGTGSPEAAVGAEATTG